MSFERRRRIYLCRNLKVSVQEFWPRLKKWLQARTRRSYHLVFTTNILMDAVPEWVEAAGSVWVWLWALLSPSE
jgi:hypothetical protein